MKGKVGAIYPSYSILKFTLVLSNLIAFIFYFNKNWKKSKLLIILIWRVYWGHSHLYHVPQVKELVHGGVTSWARRSGSRVRVPKLYATPGIGGTECKFFPFWFSEWFSTFPCLGDTIFSILRIPANFGGENGNSMAFGSKAPKFNLWLLTLACHRILGNVFNFA